MEMMLGDVSVGQVFLIAGRKGQAAGPWRRGAALPSGKIMARHIRRLSYEIRLDPATAVEIAPAGSRAGG